MRSQKQKNRAPRPFKNQFAERAWSGGNRRDPLPGPAKKTPAKKAAAAEAKPALPAPDSDDGTPSAKDPPPA